LISYYLIVLVRKGDKQDKLFKFHRELKDLLSKNVDLSKWFLDNFRNDSLISELIIVTHEQDIKVLINGLLETALQVEYKFDYEILEDSVERYKKFVDKSVSAKIANLYIGMLGQKKENLK
jgi:hypothetical protein